ncbi:E3 ubiquitin-protein ligase march2 [Mactra antiquata]
MSHNYYVQQADHKMNDKYKVQQDSVSRGTGASSCANRFIQKTHASNLSLPSGKSVDSSRKSHTSKSCRSNYIDSQNTSIQSEGIVCRICHEDDTAEVLVSPCYCSGSMGLLHVSCLQTWLGTSNKTTCEICNFQFSLVRKTMPVSQFLRNPGTAQDKRNFICDIISFLIITPLTVFVVWVCLKGATDQYYDSKLEKSGLISLSACLVILYFVWLTVAIRHNWRVWNDWKMFHQEVTLLCQPSNTLNQSNSHKDDTKNVASSDNSHKKHGRVKLESVMISISGPVINYKKPRRREHTDNFVKKVPNTQSTQRSCNENGYGKGSHNRFTPSDHGNFDLEARSRSHERSKLYYNSSSLDESAGSSLTRFPANFQNSRNNTYSESQSSCIESTGNSSEKSSSCATGLKRNYENYGRNNHLRYKKTDCSYQQGYSYNGTNKSNMSSPRYHPAQRDYLPCGSQQVYYSNPLYESQARVIENGHDLENRRYPYAGNLYSGPGTIFSRGGSPHDDQSQSYIARWVNQHTKNNEEGCNGNKLNAIKEMTKNPSHTVDMKTSGKFIEVNDYRASHSYKVPFKTGSNESQGCIKHENMSRSNPKYTVQETSTLPECQIYKSDLMNNVNLAEKNVQSGAEKRYSQELNVVNCDNRWNNECDIMNKAENNLGNSAYHAENIITLAENSKTQIENRPICAEISKTYAENSMNNTENSRNHAENRKTHAEHNITCAENNNVHAENRYSRQLAMDEGCSQSDVHEPLGNNQIEKSNSLLNAQVSSLQTTEQNDVNSMSNDPQDSVDVNTNTVDDDINDTGDN